MSHGNYGMIIERLNCAQKHRVRVALVACSILPL